MTEWNYLLASMAATTADYREGNLVAPTPAYVECWANLFNAAVILALVQETEGLLGAQKHERGILLPDTDCKPTVIFKKHHFLYGLTGMN